MIKLEYFHPIKFRPSKLNFLSFRKFQVFQYRHYSSNGNSNNDNDGGNNSSSLKRYECVEELMCKEPMVKPKIKASNWRHDDFIKKISAKQKYSSILNNKDNVDLSLLKQQQQLVPKTMSDSCVEKFLPLKSDVELLEDYISPYGGIRLGKIFENLDLLAGASAYKHCEIDKSNLAPFLIVTASVDRLDLLIKHLKINDLRLIGHVTYVGYSSMEVLIKMESLKDGVMQKIETNPEYIFNENQDKLEMIMIARFTMVAKDPKTGQAARVNPLQLENEKQKRLFQMGKARKIESAAKSLNKLPPTEDERLLIHDLYLEYRKYADTKRKEKKPDDIIWMDETIMESVVLMQPQYRNIHGFIFGGYLMKLAYELAFSNASVFLRNRPVFLALDEISFRKPVLIGSVLSLSSQIVYSPGTPHQSFQVAVTADVLDIEKEKRDTTNIFHFTFTSYDIINVRRVIPNTYGDLMKFLEDFL
ncbi:12043_t:CDS:10 [Entrophospora sp. SA101]|nr:12043_t:CDS:10 [Entrophospora sp. SA101]CAJ0905014.1 5730_t:CDS:10 [Entrophospora sp. SA101]